jgi:cytochrome P450
MSMSTSTPEALKSARARAVRALSTRCAAPGPRGGYFLGNLFEAQRDPLAYFGRMIREYGDHVAVRFGPYRYFIVNDPDAVRQILVDNHKNYRKSYTYDALKLVLGDGLVTSEGDFWRRQRRLAQPAFHKERLASFVGTMVSEAAAMLEKWSRGDPKVTFDLHREMMGATLRIVTRTLFSTNSDAEADAVGHAMSVAIEHVNEYADAIIKIPQWVPTPKNVRFGHARRTLDALVLRIINERRKAVEKPNDLLSMLMSAQDEETREQMTDRQLRDEVMTLVAAGHETTANLLTWTLYCLARRPELAQRLRDEVRAVLGDRAPGLEDLPRLAFTRAVLEEGLRLYPPAWVLERLALADDTLGGYRVRRGTVVAMTPYWLHRNARYWDDPEKFDPDRFSPSATAVATRPKYAYLPFGGGPRLCIGNAFAMMEAQIILAMVAARWSLELPPGFAVELDSSVTLRPRGGLWVTRARIEEPAAV